MATGATVHTFDIHLADMDRGVFEELSIRAARHPSETDAYLLTRVLGYCLEYEEGIAFAAGGVSSTDEPAVLVRDLTGRITAWIEVGAPDAARLHAASKLADRVAVYTHRDPERVLAALRGKTIHRAKGIRLRSFDRSFIDAAARRLARRNSATLTVTEGQCYLELNGEPLQVEIGEFRIA